MAQVDDLGGMLVSVIGAGKLMGEVSMMQAVKKDQSRGKRLLNGACKSDVCILLVLNTVVFDLIIKEALRRERENIARFVYGNLPGIRQSYTFNKILSTISYVWERKTVSGNEVISLEGSESNRIYMVKSGQVALCKKFTYN